MLTTMGTRCANLYCTCVSEKQHDWLFPFSAACLLFRGKSALLLLLQLNSVQYPECLVATFFIFIIFLIHDVSGLPLLHMMMHTGGASKSVWV